MGTGPPGEGGVLPPGTQFGRYVIKKVLGEGGMGVVYAAFDPSLNRKIAIKVLRVAKGDPAVDTQAARSRMLREAQAMAMVGHPNLVQVFDVGTYSDDVFIAMEYVDGGTLRDWTAEKGRSWEEVLRVYLDAAKGLAAAHRRKLIHRDFKPENVMVDGDSHVRVMDFGLARSTGGSDVSNTLLSTPNVLNAPLTQTGMIMGTPAYMAPEQFLAENTDHRTDQFSFCVALFEALYGHRPFGGDTMSQLARNVMRGTIELPGKHPAPGHVLDALLKGLQCDVADRHDSMDVLIDALTTAPDTTATKPSWIWPITSGAVLATGMLLYWVSARMLEERTDDPNVRQVTINRPAPEQPEIPEPEGVVTEEQMAAVISKNQEDVGECRDKGLDRDPDLHGSVGLHFEIRTDPERTKQGVVERVHLDDSQIFDKKVARCLLGMAMNWDVPAPSCTAPAVACTAKVAVNVRIDPPPGDLPGKKKRKKRG